MTNIVNFIRETNINSFCAFGSAVDAQMNSIEIAKLIGVRHDNLKTSIERLVESGVIRTPAMKVFEEINNLGFNVPREVYVFEGEQGKRDSYVIVAQNNPIFMASIVDRWIELEKRAAFAGLPDFTDPGEAARAWAEQFEQKVLAQKEATALSKESHAKSQHGMKMSEFMGTTSSKVSREGLRYCVEKGWLTPHYIGNKQNGYNITPEGEKYFIRSTSGNTKRHDVMCLPALREVFNPKLYPSVRINELRNFAA
ncbi:Rha family transcriptional regulator [Atlantibacter hermannii]|uniref:Rha family transcriptional regulator n=1 Tax=Atlantibacter TaxID=1903434 RepID=UPI0016067DE5|nr:Rha family transcriptional regulator [Atlantibacter sp. RC6]MBB3320653.1 phage regulator Rha-like protein [Atlantibacter sp. RC6]